MKKKISKEKLLKILKYVGIGLAALMIVGFVSSLFSRGDGDGVRVPQRPTVEETETESSSELENGGANTEAGWGEFIPVDDGNWTKNY